MHSDRCGQYYSRVYQAFTRRLPGVYQAFFEANRLQCSMSAKGNCYENACAESFLHSLKVEAIHGERFVTRAVMKQAVFEYIEVDYNRIHRHSANGFISSELFDHNESFSEISTVRGQDQSIEVQILFGTLTRTSASYAGIFIRLTGCPPLSGRINASIWYRSFSVSWL